MSDVQRVAKNTFALFIAQFVTSILSIILSISIARNLGDVVFGRYSFALAFTTFFAIFSSLGYDILLIREVARDKSQASRYVSNILNIRALLSLVIFVLIVVVINLLDYPAYTKNVVYIFGIYTLIESLSGVFRGTFRAFEKMEYDASITVLGNIIRVSLGLLVLFLGYGLIELALIFLFSGVFDLAFSSLVCEIKFVKTKIGIDWDFWKNSIKLAIPLGMLSIFDMIYIKADTIMLSMMKGDAVVGWYNAAYNLVLGLKPIPYLFMGALLPLMSHYYVSSKNSLKITYAKSFKYLLILGVPITVGITLLADRIILLFYGQQFYPSIIALQILAGDVLLIFLYSSLGALLIAVDRQNQMAIIAAFTALLNVILNLILIPPLSYVGAGIATITAETVLFGLYVYVISKNFYALPFHKIVIKPIVATLVMGFFIYFCGFINLFLLIILAIFLYFAILYFIKGISREDVNYFRQIFMRTKNV